MVRWWRSALSQHIKSTREMAPHPGSRTHTRSSFLPTVPSAEHRCDWRALGAGVWRGERGERTLLGSPLGLGRLTKSTESLLARRSSAAVSTGETLALGNTVATCEGIVHACQDLARRGDYSCVGESGSESAPVQPGTRWSTF